MHALLLAGSFNAARITAWSTCVLAAGVFFAAFQLSETRRTRDGDLAIKLSERLDGEDFTKLSTELKTISDLPATMRQLYLSDLTKYQWYISEADFFEDVGALYRRRVLGVRVVELFMGTRVTERWDDWSAYLTAIRDGDEDGVAHPTWYTNFERLATHLAVRAERPPHRWRRLFMCWLRLRLGT